ncbi:hypothetical protein D2V17_00675 [Aurantiacibacter xanthus]|uniref:Uncharacterized protein n=1 Tax=Aurantiacibacter xanthus TaxID=1784712 RepID=A0A3A1PIH6_9SPHN|nr:hypothetical protein [Aurantiacibacter xanthus]RIV93366.1 hypothetical protein D2V17_00675 [Aurantiacibacter xanthus]
MSIAAISPRTAHVLMRIRWLAWGAIAALMAVHLAALGTPAPHDDAVPNADIVAASGPALG